MKMHGTYVMHNVPALSNGTLSALLALCAGNSPVTGEFPRTKTGVAELWYFLWSADDLRRHRAHYDVTVMLAGAADCSGADEETLFWKPESSWCVLNITSRVQIDNILSVCSITTRCGITTSLCYCGTRKFNLGSNGDWMSYRAQFI